MANASVLLSPSALEVTHFIYLCSQRTIPLVFLVNVSGYTVGEKAERGGIAKDGAKVVRAVARAKVPKFTVVVGGSYEAVNYVLPSISMDVAQYKNMRHGPNQLSSVIQTVSSKRGSYTDEKKEDRYQELREKIERQNSALCFTARIWVGAWMTGSSLGLVGDILGLGLELALEEEATCPIDHGEWVIGVYLGCDIHHASSSCPACICMRSYTGKVPRTSQRPDREEVVWKFGDQQVNNTS
ncbi:hypothetical protein TREMEDRAFT_62806 [Tremella mesenterica DSM 1558]|uniref:uncharacterized protein n=1 Tax=Tremella mesenterica (strain ATCC 24925 / CBS 8224 / DSM 1558 / NBRC 9311 / NRRL Y-6157 / RJB 2259-6 / UBC 559-6) TaxID=578456 RepID=UPI0003F49A61|nr:uncharacterized protein TREMEDRAFT_62806 [Tremella mesenterica DSM 1558]EIW69078.1 hypothetical protein TREMEDRAFT_62806 [Tremella mesenterica DSM 1558]